MKQVAALVVVAVVGCSRNEPDTARAASTSVVAQRANALAASTAGGSLPKVKPPVLPESTPTTATEQASAVVAPIATSSSSPVASQSARVVKGNDVPELGKALLVWLEHRDVSTVWLGSRKPSAIALGTVHEVMVASQRVLVVPFRWEEAYCGVAIVGRDKLEGTFYLPPSWGGIGEIWDCRRPMTLKSTLDLNGDNIPDFFYVTDFYSYQHDEYMTLPMAFLSDVSHRTYCYEDELSSSLHILNAATLKPKQIQRLAKTEIVRLAKARRVAGTCDAVFKQRPPPVW